MSLHPKVYAWGLASAAIAVGLSACISLGGLGGGGSPPQLYTLTAVTEFEGTSSTLKKKPSIAIEAASSDAVLATSRIVIKKSPLTFDYLADASWADEAPKLVQRLFIESFENSKLFSSVSADTLSTRPEYSLQLELRDFQAEYNHAKQQGSGPVAQVKYSLRLIKMPQRTVISSDVFNIEQSSTENSKEAIVKAFNEANQRAITQSLTWVSSHTHSLASSKNK